MTNSDRISLLAALLAVSISQGSPAYAQEDDTARLGSVHFATSCNEAAQRRFDRGMRYEHSFWYSAANEVFDDVLKADSTCAIAYWGKALALLSNPHNPVPAANLPLGLAAIEKAKSLNAKTKRERDLIDALSLMYVDYDKLDHRTRIQKYLAAMEQVASLYPDDDEVQLRSHLTKCLDRPNQIFDPLLLRQTSDETDDKRIGRQFQFAEHRLALRPFVEARLGRSVDSIRDATQFFSGYAQTSVEFDHTRRITDQSIGPKNQSSIEPRLPSRFPTIDAPFGYDDFGFRDTTGT